MKRIQSTLIMLLLAVIGITAAPRNKSAIASVAARALNGSNATSRAPRMDQLQTLASTKAYTIMGYASGGYAIVSNDDLAPALLGVSDRQYEPNRVNPALRWYLSAAEEVINNAVAHGTRLKIVTPDTVRFAKRIEPFVDAMWGQEAPFNNLCPYGTTTGAGSWQSYGSTDRTVTGCVATAMAEIIYYNRYPKRGQGIHSVSVKQPGGSKINLSIDFSKSLYDYDNMLDDYGGTYTEAQAEAVAKLMLDCGVASDMTYGTDASGTYTANACEGLRRNFGYPASTRVLKRSGYDEEKWMEAVYTELNEQRAIFYTGIDPYNGGHAFVIDGYNTDGLVHVNWGWKGSNNGYYNIALLNPNTLQFSTYQDMIVGFRGYGASLAKDTINVAEAGTLPSLLPDSLSGKVSGLKITGNINSTDLKQLRLFAGRDASGSATNGQLASLDLKEARIVAGGEPYLIDNGRSLTTANNVLPERAFYGCQGLTTLLLPESIDSIGDGALGGLTNLDSLYVPTGQDKHYVVANNVIYTPDTAEVIAATSLCEGELRFNAGVNKLHDYALAGCPLVSSVNIPGTVTYIGAKAFAGMYGIKDIHVYAHTPPTLGSNAFSDVDLSQCKLYVLTGLKKTYAAADQWSDFIATTVYGSFDNIVEFGTLVKVNNAVRKYGQANPSFSWKVSGDAIDGIPAITCEATRTSPVGTYEVKASRGSITNEALEFQSGVLTVRKNTARLTADTVLVEKGTVSPVFTYTVDSLRNGETSIELTREPTFRVADSNGNTVSLFNEVGAEYVLIPSNAESQNYNFSYHNGLVRVVEALPTGIKGAVTDRSDIGKEPVYNLTGQRIKTPKHGVYVVKGRKYVVK